MQAAMAGAAGPASARHETWERTMKFKADARTLGWFLLPIVLVVAAAAWFALDPGFRGYGDAPEATLPDDELDRRIRAYIVENPEVLVEAMQRLQARQSTAAASEAEAVLRARADEVFQDAASPVDRKSPRLNSRHSCASRMPPSA